MFDTIYQGGNEFSLAITSGGTRSARDWAILGTKKIINVSDSAPPPIRDQAQAFREKILRVMENYIEMAQQEQRSHAAHIAETNGSPEIAEMIRKQMEK